MDCSSRYPEESKSRAYAIVISTKFVHPCAMTFDESPCELTATALAKALARREISARDAARGPTGPLHGLPIAVKDLTNTRGLRTTYGSLLFQHHIPMQDELVVARLRQAGAVIIGKTTTPEFGFGAVGANRLCGPTRNPFALALTSGGSYGPWAGTGATG